MLWMASTRYYIHTKKTKKQKNQHRGQVIAPLKNQKYIGPKKRTILGDFLYGEKIPNQKTQNHLLIA